MLLLLGLLSLLVITSISRISSASLGRFLDDFLSVHIVVIKVKVVTQAATPFQLVTLNQVCYVTLLPTHMQPFMNHVLIFLNLLRIAWKLKTIHDHLRSFQISSGAKPLKDLSLRVVLALMAAVLRQELVLCYLI
jgi:hypothetical protein